jgi:hypothetical protein
MKAPENKPTDEDLRDLRRIRKRAGSKRELLHWIELAEEAGRGTPGPKERRFVDDDLVLLVAAYYERQGLKQSKALRKAADWYWTTRMPMPPAEARRKGLGGVYLTAPSKTKDGVRLTPAQSKTKFIRRLRDRPGDQSLQDFAEACPWQVEYREHLRPPFIFIRKL